MAADSYADKPLAPEHGERNNRRVAAALEQDDALLWLQPAVVRMRGTEEWRAGDVVVADIRVLAVGTREARVARQHETVRIATSELAPGDDLDRKLPEPCAGVATDECLAAELLPPRLGLAVVHHQVGVTQVAGGAERECAPANAPVERDRGV